MKTRIKNYLKRTVFQHLVLLRFLGFRIAIMDASVGWTLVTYRDLFVSLLKRRTLLFQIQDICHWSWVVNRSQQRPSVVPESASVKYGLCDFFQVLPCQFGQVALSDLKRQKEIYTKEFDEMYNGLCVFKERAGLDLVVYCQGYTTGSSACRMVAIEENVPLLALENTSDATKLLWETISGISVNRTFSRNYYWRFKEFVTNDQVESYRSNKLANIHSKKSYEHVSGQGDLSLSAPYILFLGQVYTDTSIIFGVGPDWLPEDVVECLAQEAVVRGMKIVVKCHPRESNGTSAMSHRRYDNLTYRKIKQRLNGRYVDDIIFDYENTTDTYKLIGSASVVVTMNSQSGLEALLYAKPVLTCAPSNYSHLGFTYDCASRGSLPSLLDAALSRTLEEGKRHLFEASTFDYIYFVKYCIEKSKKSLSEKIHELIK